MKQINLKLHPHQIDLLNQVGNRSEYIRTLIEKDANSEVRFKYAADLITTMCVKAMRENTEIEIISMLGTMLAGQMSGSDQLGAILERVGK